MENRNEFMDPLGILTGFALIAGGVYSIRSPQSVRSFPKPKEWNENRNKAEKKQEEYAAIMGLVLIGLGILVLSIGLLS